MFVKFRLYTSYIRKYNFICFLCCLCGYIRWEKRSINKVVVLISCTVFEGCSSSNGLIIFVKITRHYISVKITTLCSSSYIFIVGTKCNKYFRTSSGFIVIINKVNLFSSSISSSVAPIVNHIICDVHSAGISTITV